MKINKLHRKGKLSQKFRLIKSRKTHLLRLFIARATTRFLQASELRLGNSQRQSTFHVGATIKTLIHLPLKPKGIPSKRL